MEKGYLTRAKEFMHEIEEYKKDIVSK